MKAQIHSLILLLVSTVLGIEANGQGNATVREFNKSMPTYNFSDPDPVANIGRIYPYYRFDGYSTEAVDKEWKFIELENDYIKVLITPEIGGKVWAAIEKSTGKEFIYYNHVVKFRDVAMRGPWTSGGIELNFGAIGHAPTCSTPVDYLIQKNEDGSVSCFLGAIDLASRTEWRVEINLPADKSWFTTKALWHNPTQMNQSYYQWMNAGVKTAGNLEYAYPGTNYIGHDGSLHSWPIHPEGMDLSWYEKNNFGGYKSYHVVGELTNFFGGYWHDDEFGFGHYADYDGKPGKKLWIWGLSRQGMIWENLLTDTDGQYTEIQSGRLFNQEASNSIYSPFKHRSFPPYVTDEWTEYWFPVMNTKGVVQASPQASINLKSENGSTHLWLSANEVINDKLIVEVGGKALATFELQMKPTDVIHHIIDYSGPKDQLSVKIGSEYIISPGGIAEQKLSRPLETVDFDWNTVQGMAMKALALEQERNYTDALDQYLNCLEKDPNYLPALVGASGLFYRKTAYNKALALASRALSIDTYYPSANFIYGVINAQLGNITDAIDGFSLAAASVEYKSAAYLELSRIYFKRKEYDKSLAFAQRSLDFNAKNLTASELLLLSLRKSNSNTLEDLIKQSLKKDPLNHFAHFENYLLTNDAKDLTRFKELIRNELAYETYLELAIKYYNLELIKESDNVLKSAAEYAMVSYWQAYLSKNVNTTSSAIHLKKANDLPADLVFPFRQESIPVLQWAITASNSWKPKYYLGLIWWNIGNIEKAKEYFIKLGDEPDFYAFYLAKAELFSDRAEVVDQSLKMAYKLSPKSWRTGLALSNHYINNNDYGNAIKTIKPLFKKDPTNYYVGLNYAKALMLNKQYGECLELLQNLNVLPNEGATEGRHLYRISSLNIAIEALEDKEFDIAQTHVNLAKSWPENLGVGKPYVTDERIENYILALVFQQSGKAKKAGQLFQEIIDSSDGNIKTFSAREIIVLAAYLKQNQDDKAGELLNIWRNSMIDDPYVHWATLWLQGNPKELTSYSIEQNWEDTVYKIGSREYYLQWVMNMLMNNQIKK